MITSVHTVLWHLTFIICTLILKSIFSKFCNYGHFTHADAPWEQTDMTEVLESACHAKEMGGSAR